MNIRRAAPLLFAALCLSLSGLVLHRQITAHPAPQPTEWPPEPHGVPNNPDPARPVGKTWHVAGGPARRAALTAITSQLAALRTGNAERAWFYQSRGLHRNFASAQQFTQMIQRGYPEFGHSRAAAFSPVLMDQTEDQAAVVVTVMGEDGRQARGFYQLIREDGGYKVAGVAGGAAIR